MNLAEARISRRVVELPDLLSGAPAPGGPLPTEPEEEARPIPRPIAASFETVPGLEAHEPGEEISYEDVVDPAWIGKRVEYQVVYSNRKKRSGSPSEVVSIDPKRELPPPAAPVAEPGDGFVSLRWRPPEGIEDVYGYAVFRRLQGSPSYPDSPLNAEPIPETDFEDRGALFGAAICYVVASVLMPGEAELPARIESLPSEEVCLTPEDRFAPGAAAGLLALPSSDGILLTWRASDARDLRGYRVYRSDSASGEFSLLAEVSTTSYNDPSASPGETLFYVVTAIDSAPLANESQKSEVAEATRPR